MDSKNNFLTFSDNGINITKIDSWKEVANFGTGQNLHTKFCPISLRSQYLGSVVGSSLGIYNLTELVNEMVS